MSFRNLFKKKKKWFDFFINAILFEFILFAVSLFVPAYYYVRCNVPKLFHIFGNCELVRNGSNLIKGFDYSVFVLSYLLIFTFILFIIYLCINKKTLKEHLQDYNFPKKKYWVFLVMISIFLFFWKGMFAALLAILYLVFMLIVFIFKRIIFAFWWSPVYLVLIIVIIVLLIKIRRKKKHR